MVRATCRNGGNPGGLERITSGASATSSAAPVLDTAAPPTSVMNSRRLKIASQPEDRVQTWRIARKRSANRSGGSVPRNPISGTAACCACTASGSLGGGPTGVTSWNAGLGPKRLELLHELVPTANIIAVLVNPTNANVESDIRDAEASARTLGVRLHILCTRAPNTPSTPLSWPAGRRADRAEAFPVPSMRPSPANRLPRCQNHPTRAGHRRGSPWLVGRLRWQKSRGSRPAG